jgi:hypothetical protein
VQQSASVQENTLLALSRKFSIASCAMAAKKPLPQSPKWSNIVHI